MIRLRVPGALKYRDLAVRAVAAACKLVGPRETGPTRPFDDQVVSAFGEAFNNAAEHSYRGRDLGDVEIEIDVAGEAVTIRLLDWGNSFALDDIPEPDLDALPESGLGLFIIKSFMDDVSYEPGSPNVLSMTKRLSKEFP
jgi:serine/threonine-protein kinase RsbW